MPAADLEQLQRSLVDQLQLNPALKDTGVPMAFSAVARHHFLPHINPRHAYRDEAITLETGQHGETVSSASQPTMMAIMLEQLDLRAGHECAGDRRCHRLQCRPDQTHGRREWISDYAGNRQRPERARAGQLVQAGHSDVLVVNRDAVGGYEPRAQYDRIIATAGVWDVPTAWLRQLREEGILVTPIWLDGVQVSAAFTKQPDGSLLSRDNRPCAFVYLQGLAAGPQVRKRIGSSSVEILADDVDKIDTAALHLLLSEDQEINHLPGNLEPEDYWFGFQLHVMLNEPARYVFAVYAIPDGESWYGMEGNGILLFTPGSVAFAPYAGGGVVHCFGSSVAFIKLQGLLDEWRLQASSLLDRLRLQLVPMSKAAPTECAGKLFARKDHYLRVWLN